FLADAATRAAELGVAERVSFEHRDAAGYVSAEPYDVVCCIGATWIGRGLTGTIELLRRSVAPGGLLLIGEPYWIDPPPAEAYQAYEFEPDEFSSLDGTLDRFEAAGVELVEMVLANSDDWDRYTASQWWNLTEWLRDNPDHPELAPVRQFRDRWRRAYLRYGRRYLGWGVFVLRVAP
ncbi:MAG: SAM-dependent methyltransferase, partial [Micromonosporaceae bacterium]